MKKLQNRVKKLALAYQTGWEYIPGDKEAGSVITDIFLGMMEENRKRYERIWDKQELEFLNEVPLYHSKPGLLKSALLIKAPGEANGKELPQGSKAYMVLEDGSLLWFSTCQSLQLTTAVLKCAVYEKGLSSWQVWDKENPIPLFAPSGQELSHPVFRWRFSNLCNGLKQSRFMARLSKECGIGDMASAGDWSIADDRYRYSLKWEEALDGTILYGETPGFAGNLQDTEYEIILDIPCGDINNGMSSGIPDMPCKFSLKESSVTLEAELCLTDDAIGDGKRVLPFGYTPDDAACCYLACDGILARERGEISLQFRESYQKEEKLPPERAEGEEKIYKKYPWLKQTERLQDWMPRETVWEYFNGRVWRMLPGSGLWNTGCVKEEDQNYERHYRWHRPKDMMPCSIEGEEHFYIRLRTVKVDNPYAAYYRKYIPVLENIRFSAEETIWECVGQDIPELLKTGQEKMCLGFDRIVTPGNRWVTEYGSFSFDEKQIAGWGHRFGENAFWVEFTQAELQEVLNIPSDAVGIRLTANYVEILQIPDTAEMIPDTQEIEILQGTAFHVETKEMGALDAISAADTYYNRTGAPCPAGRKAAENFFLRFGRLLTPMDIESLFEEKYPAFQVLSCEYQQESKALLVETLAQDGYGDDAFDESKLKEVQEWLEDAAHSMGSLWLKECHVKIKVLRLRE